MRHTIFFIPGTHLIWLYFANPVDPVVMTFQRVFYNVWNAHSTLLTPAIVASPADWRFRRRRRHRATGDTGDTASSAHHAPAGRYPIHWYVAADLAVLGVSVAALPGRHGRVRAPRGQLRRGALSRT